MVRSSPRIRPQLRLWLLASVMAGGLVVSRDASALTLGQSDGFEDGTTQGWVINLLGTGSPPAGTLPTNVATGGPSGANDNYLQLTSNGTGGSGGRLVAINVSQWAGDYTALGVTGISASLRNFGATDLSLRLLVSNPTTGPPTASAISTNAIFLAANSGWVDVFFPLSAGDLTALVGSTAAALSGATELRILHSASASFPGAPIVAQLGVDNFTAVPEPGAGLLLGMGLTALAARRKGRDQRSPATCGSAALDAKSGRNCA